MITKIRIVNETGRFYDTRVLDADTGEELRGVSRIAFEPIDGEHHFLQATLTFLRNQIDFVTEHFTVVVDREQLRLPPTTQELAALSPGHAYASGGTVTVRLPHGVTPQQFLDAVSAALRGTHL